MNIVLLEPEIPHNTGAVGRTCSVTGSRLHLIRPLGFSTDERYLRRAGLDYWRTLDISYYDSFANFCETYPDAKIYMVTTKAQKCYSDVSFKPDDFLMFGKESAGIPEEILLEYRETAIRIPMLPDSRSLNLSVSAGIILYEALRQNGFPGLETKGKLHARCWEDA